MGYTLEDWIRDSTPEGKEDDAINEIKQALVSQILKHSKQEITKVLDWVNENTQDDEIMKDLVSPFTTIESLLLILSNIATKITVQ